MGLDSLPVSSLGGAGIDSALQIGMSILSGLINLALMPLFIVVVVLVLYYYTGNEKKADQFMPRLMAQLLRILHYTWLFIISIFAFSGLNQVLNFVFTSILPQSDFADEPEGKSFIQGIVLLILMAIFAGGYVLLNRKVVEISKVGATISTKYFLSFGLLTFSILMFISVISVFTGLIDFIDDSDLGIDGGSVALMFSSITFFVMYLVKTMDVLRRESK